MAHFAKLGANSKVIQVLTLDNKDMLNADGVEDEAVGQQYLEQHSQTHLSLIHISEPTRPY